MNQLEKFRDIHTFIFDVDGVLTNSQVIVLEEGKLLRKMSIRDGYAIKRAVQEGFRVAVITGGRSEGVKLRLQDLGVTDIYLGAVDKFEAYQEFKELYDLETDGILYMGDDIPDYQIMRKVGLPCCPSNAAPEIKEVSLYISPYHGGEGCARDVIEKVLRLHGKWLPE